MFEFASPWAFFLLPLPLVVYFFIPRARYERAAIRVPFFNQIRSLYDDNVRLKAGNNLVNAVIIVLIWLLLLTASAKPQWVGEPISIPASGRDLLVAVDISTSMREEDMLVDQQYVPRISVVKYVVGEFVERRQGDRMGLILFGTEAFLFAPLTFDRNTVNELLQETQTGFAGMYTAIGDAIGLAIKRLRDRPASQRVLILLTDGANTAGEVAPRRAAELAQQAGIKIYTIGIGADEIVRRDLFGRARKTNPSIDLDEDALRFIADSTGGQYFRARNPAELVEIYSALDELEPIDQENEVYRPVAALFYWPLAAALVLSFFLALLRTANFSFSGAVSAGRQKEGLKT